MVLLRDYRIAKDLNSKENSWFTHDGIPVVAKDTIELSENYPVGTLAGTGDFHKIQSITGDRGLVFYDSFDYAWKEIKIIKDNSND